MPELCYLGVDLGAESGRVIAGLFDGERFSLEPLHRFPNEPVNLGDSLRWDVLRLWWEIQQGLTRAAGRFGDAIVSAGVDTWGVDYVLLSHGDELIGAPFHYRDPRTEGMPADAFARVPRKDIFAETGLQFLPFNTLFQLLAMQRVEPSLLGAADRLLMMPDFFHWCLSGSRVVEFTNATTTQCFNPASGDWSSELLRRFDLPAGIFGEVVPTGTHLGTLRGSVAQRTGLSRIDVVAPATHDTGSAVVAVPTERTGSPSWAYISSGTWSLMGVEVPAAILTDRALELNVTNEGGIDGTYRLLKNIMGLWLVQECRRSFERSGKPYDYAVLTERASQAPAFRSLVEPDDPSFLSPDDMPAAIGAWCRRSGQPVPDDEGQFVRCALESLALKYCMVLEWLEELTGTRVEIIHIVGGGCQNGLLNQFTADACGRPVVAGPIEATALGNVLVQARSSGELGTLADMRDVVRQSTQLARYEPTREAPWQEAYGRFVELRARYA